MSQAFDFGLHKDEVDKIEELYASFTEGMCEDGEEGWAG